MAALLAAEPDPSDGQIAAALQPNICRCGCYARISRAVHRAAGLAGESGRPGPELASAAALALARPRRPWDLCEPADRDWSGILGDALATVWPPAEPAAGTWAANGGAWLHVAPSGAVTAFTR